MFIRRSAFTMLELIFVIVIMGIIGKFGVEFLAQAYKNFIFSSINNRLQSSSAMAVELISAKLQNRIKDSVIARQNAATFEALAGSTLAENATILEWVGTDMEGFRGDTSANWSGVIDIDNANASTTTLISPGTNTTTINALIDDLSNSGSGINDAALYFIGSNTNINGFGWDGNAITDQNQVMHPINSIAGNVDRFTPIRGDTGAVNSFSGVDVYEYYKLAWTAYAVVHEDGDGDGTADDLVLYYDYQPWRGETYTSVNTKSALLMQDVSTFRFRAIGSVVKIQVCVKSNLTGEEYSICKEKTVF
jgi:Tfp pilus assembly protein FimT